MPRKKPSRRGLLAGTGLLVVATGARAQPPGHPAEVVSVVERYAAALRSNDVETLVALYASNGVFMRQDMPAAVGRDALRAAYREIFATLKVDLAFEVQETEVAGDMAWLRAISKGRIRVLATGSESSGSFDVLAVLSREQGVWRIRSYMYASNRPGTAASR
jgi:uncharacterized protein (TIGR02246 family)